MNAWKDVFKDMALFLSTGGERFRWTLPLSKSSCFVLFDRPGRWCTDAELKKITEDMIRVAAEGQQDKEVPLYGPLLGDRSDLKDRVISIAYDKSGEPIGFSAQKYLDLREDRFRMVVLHLGLIFVSPKAQGRNLSYLLGVLPNVILTLKAGLRPAWVSSVSQVPTVVGLVAKSFSDVYPNVDGARQTFLHKKYASLIVRDHRAAFGVGSEAGWDARRQVLTNAYTGGSDHLKKQFSSAPKHRDPRINELCERELDYERGDDFVQVGLLSPAQFIDLFKKKMKKQNAVQLTMNLSLFFVLSLLLPMVRWLIPGAEFYATSGPGRRPLIYSGDHHEF